MNPIRGSLLLFLLSVMGCQHPKYYHAPGGPYYFNSGETYQGYRPYDEITKQEADIHAEQGHAYTVAIFDKNGQPITVEKIYKGKIDSHVDLVYSNSVLRQVLSTEADGSQRRTYFDEKGHVIKPE